MAEVDLHLVHLLQNLRPMKINISKKLFTHLIIQGIVLKFGVINVTNMGRVIHTSRRESTKIISKL